MIQVEIDLIDLVLEDTFCLYKCIRNNEKLNKKDENI